MSPLRPVLVTALLGALVASTAHAAPARVSGGGFYRDRQGRNATKSMLNIAGTPSDNSGTAEYKVDGPRKAKSVTRIALTCVVVEGNTAYASGRDTSGQDWFIKVVDNGEPGRNDQYGVSRTGETPLGIALLAPLAQRCRAGSVATRPITGGGNFQVVPAS